jgi:hypothetical protein
VKATLIDYVTLPKSLVIHYNDGTQSINFFDMETFFELVTPDIVKKMRM